jgi:hypothetical protein
VVKPEAGLVVPGSQSSVVQSRPSEAGTSPRLTPPAVTTLPAPSHTSSRQSPTVPSPTTWLAGWNATPQVLLTQVCVAQAVSLPQSAGTLQPTQLPAASHTSEAPQLVPAVTGTWVGAPLAQPSVVQSFWSSGSSRSSSTSVVPPAPSHTASKQSPTLCEARGVPSAAKPVPHTPALHSATSHSFEGVGQSVASMQPTHTPLPSQKRPTPHVAPSALGV